MREKYVVFVFLNLGYFEIKKLKLNVPYDPSIPTPG